MLEIEKLPDIVSFFMQTTLALRITGDSLDPEGITNILRVNPRSSGRKGSERASCSPKKIISKFGFWFWKSDEVSYAMPIVDHLALFKSTFEHAFDLLGNLPNAEHVWLNICIVKTEEDGGDSSVEFMLDTKSAAMIAEIGLPVEFSVYGNFEAS